MLSVMQGIDIFSKDFLLIPIHDALHWSLVIVCHPGLDFEASDRKPYILHLDSMEGEHYAEAKRLPLHSQHCIHTETSCKTSCRTRRSFTSSFHLEDLFTRRRAKV